MPAFGCSRQLVDIERTMAALNGPRTRSGWVRIIISWSTPSWMPMVAASSAPVSSPAADSLR